MRSAGALALVWLTLTSLVIVFVRGDASRLESVQLGALVATSLLVVGWMLRFIHRSIIGARSEPADGRRPSRTKSFAKILVTVVAVAIIAWAGHIIFLDNILTDRADMQLKSVSDVKNAISDRDYQIQRCAVGSNPVEIVTQCSKVVDDNNRGLLHRWLALNLRGSAHHSQKNYRAAIADFDRAIGMRPEFAEQYLNRGRAYLLSGDRLRARTDLQEAIRIDGNSTDVGKHAKSLLIGL